MLKSIEVDSFSAKIWICLSEIYNLGFKNLVVFVYEIIKNKN